MTKSVRVENADTSDRKVTVEVWEMNLSSGKDQLIETKHLDYPTALADTYIHKTRYLVVKEI